MLRSLLRSPLNRTIVGQPNGAHSAGGSGWRSSLRTRKLSPGSELVESTSCPLVHRVSPVSAAVSADGKYVALFDNWHRTGYGPNAITIYAERGNLLRSFAVMDILVEAEIRRLSMSVSSVRWLSSVRFEGSVLAIEAYQEDPSGKTISSFTVRLDPATGRVLRLPADLKRLDEQRTSCRKLRGGRAETDWKACHAKMGSDVWCALCLSIDER